MKDKIFYFYGNNVEGKKVLTELRADTAPVAIRCYVDNEHYFDLALVDAPNEMDWFDAKIWCEERYCRLPMKHELKFICDNLSTINKMLRNAGGKMLSGYYWSSSEFSSSNAWESYFGNSNGLDSYTKGHSYYVYVRPVLTF